MAIMQKINPNLWFDKQAGEAAAYYTSIFKNSKILRTSYYGKEGFDIHQMPEGTVMVVEFELEGQKFTGLNGGPVFKFNEAVSFIINCKDQEEVDYYWNKLTEGEDKNAQQCGWLKDKFGLSWQVIPEQLGKLMSGSDSEGSQRVMNAMLQMKKINIKQLEEAYEGLLVEVAGGDALKG